MPPFLLNLYLLVADPGWPGEAARLPSALEFAEARRQQEAFRWRLDWEERSGLVDRDTAASLRCTLQARTDAWTALGWAKEAQTAPHWRLAVEHARNMIGDAAWVSGAWPPPAPWDLLPRAGP
jgi:hypothetical protein